MQEGRHSTKNDTSYKAGDKINTTVKVKNLVRGTRWSGAIVIDKPSNLIVTYYELRDPYGNVSNIWGEKGTYVTKGAGKSADKVTPQAASKPIARLSYDGQRFRMAASEIVGMEQYQVYYEGYVPEGTEPGSLEEMVEQPSSNNPLDQNKNSGPEVPEGTPSGAKLPTNTPPEQNDPKPDPKPTPEPEKPVQEEVDPTPEPDQPEPAPEPDPEPTPEPEKPVVQPDKK